VNPKDIELPNVKRLKLNIQKILSKVSLMNYGTEFGQIVTFTSTQKNQKLICKGWCLNDHLIGIEIEYKGIVSKELKELEQRFELHFPNYQIIWNKIN